MQNKDMKKAILILFLLSCCSSNERVIESADIKSKMQLKGKNVIKKIGVPKK